MIDMTFVAWCAWFAFGFGVIAIMFTAALDVVMELGKFEIDVWRGIVKERLHRLIKTSLIMPAVGFGAAIGYSMYHNQPVTSKLNTIIQEGGIAPIIGAVILWIVVIAVFNNAFIGAFDEAPTMSKRAEMRFLRARAKEWRKKKSYQSKITIMSRYDWTDDEKAEIQTCFEGASLTFIHRQNPEYRLMYENANASQ